MTTAELTKKAHDLKGLMALIDEAQAQADAIRDEIKAEMTEQDTDELRAGDLKISWKAVTTSRLDSAALKKALPDVAAQYMKTTTTRRFNVA